MSGMTIEEAEPVRTPAVEATGFGSPGRGEERSNEDNKGCDRNIAPFSVVEQESATTDDLLVSYLP
jgi:hypothetical protein